MSDAIESRALRRVTLGIPGLDTILGGGLFAGGMYLLIGSPGAGKTILANQVAYNHVERDGRALYITLLAESHGRMLAHVSRFSFFKPEVVAQSLNYISGYSVLEEEGLDGLLTMIRKEIRERKIDYLVLDSISNAVPEAGNVLPYKKFLHELQVYLEAASCTALLLTPTSGESDPTEHTIVDGILKLSEFKPDMQSVREIEVMKFRGSNFLRGRHVYTIANEGVMVYPRTEARYALPTSIPETASRERYSFGAKSFDDMLNGGLVNESMTMLLGAPGTGKTVLGLHFLTEGARQNQRGLYYGFYEFPAKLADKADNISLPFSKYVREGGIDLTWRSSLDMIIDETAEAILREVEEKGTKRLLIDGLDAFFDSVHYPSRLNGFFTALSNELRARGVTTLVTAEIPDLFGPTVKATVSGASAVVDNVIFLRYVELRSQLYRLVSILKMRDSSYESAIREFRISSHGIEVAATFESAEAILTGTARPYGNLSPYIPASEPPDSL